MPKGHHENHAKGNRLPRWSKDKIISSHGYVKVRVGVEHPLADPNGYAYEHLLVWVSAGRPVPGIGELLHHCSEDKTDNRLSNLEKLTREKHAEEHHGDRMLPDADVRAIRERYAAGEDGTALAMAFEIPHQRAYKIIRGETRRSAGGPMQSGCLRGKKAAGRLLDGREWNGVPV